MESQSHLDCGFSFKRFINRASLSLFDSVALKRSLVDLLVFLSGEGRSNANCWATDLFFAQSEEWERDWAEQNLPEGLRDVLAMMGEALHDTIQAPEIAKNFGCLPEQLLERLSATS